MASNSLKDKLQQGKTVMGTWSVIASPTVAEVLALAGLDFLIIDMEHGPTGLETAENMVRAAGLHRCAPLVRVPGVDEAMILRALDIGAWGIVVPQIQSAEQARAVIRYAKYPPDGERGHSPFTRAGGFTHRDSAARMVWLNEQIFIGLLVEGMEGIAALPDILLLRDQIDLIYIGVYDLAKAIGHPGEIQHPEVIQAIQDCAQSIMAAGVTMGVLINDTAALPALWDLGVRFFAYQNDTGLLFEAVERAVQAKDKQS